MSDLYQGLRWTKEVIPLTQLVQCPISTCPMQPPNMQHRTVIFSSSKTLSKQNHCKYSRSLKSHPIQYARCQASEIIALQPWFALNRQKASMLQRFFCGKERKTAFHSFYLRFDSPATKVQNKMTSCHSSSMTFTVPPELVKLVRKLWRKLWKEIFLHKAGVGYFKLFSPPLEEGLRSMPMCVGDIGTTQSFLIMYLSLPNNFHQIMNRDTSGWKKTVYVII